MMIKRKNHSGHVNGSLPGPTLRVKEGDTYCSSSTNLLNNILFINLINCEYFMINTMKRLCMSIPNKEIVGLDGPEYITQCPIHSGNNYTYNFNITF
ncbi:hypothetical protein Leryth_002095 [Lithospermum erythrorhizon]|nr:hypothetical protein Leryth_002095 [Lithospermum erythrorhizon]